MPAKLPATGGFSGTGRPTVSPLLAIIVPISRPNVLVITPHPVIGAGIETMLRLEDLYDLRRAGTLADGIAQAQSWPADLALIDGVLVDAPGSDLGVACIVLSGDAATGERIASELRGARGWLPKDAPPATLVAAIDSALGIVRVRNDLRGTLGMIVAVAVVLAFVAALGLFLWRFLLS